VLRQFRFQCFGAANSYVILESIHSELFNQLERQLC